MTGKALFIPDLIPVVTLLAREAGELIMGHYRNGAVAERKADASPVTAADKAADELIVNRLNNLGMSPKIVSEEGAKPDVSDAEYFWLIDPLDGTKSFVRGNGYFTVNIALIHRNAPVLGVIYEPVHKVLYWGSAQGAWRQDESSLQPIHVRHAQAEGKAALVSHSHLNTATQTYLEQHQIKERIPCASSIKFCWLAEGKADLYPRFGPTMEWDTAAGHAILNAAEGSVLTPEGTPFLYGKAGFTNGNFIAYGAGASQ